MPHLEYVNTLLLNVYNFIPNFSEVPDKQEGRVREDFRNVFHLNSEVRAALKAILVSEMLARNDVIFPVLIKEYQHLEKVLKQVKAEYSKLSKHQCTQKELKDFLDMYDPKKAMPMGINHIKQLSSKLGVEVDIKQLLAVNK